MGRLYPKSTFRKSIKDQSGVSIAKNADALLYLDYVVFLEALLKKADKEAGKLNEKHISRRHIEKHVAETLKAFKG